MCVCYTGRVYDVHRTDSENGFGRDTRLRRVYYTNPMEIIMNILSAVCSSSQLARRQHMAPWHNSVRALFAALVKMIINFFFHSNNTAALYTARLTRSLLHKICTFNQYCTTLRFRRFDSTHSSASIGPSVCGENNVIINNYHAYIRMYNTNVGSSSSSSRSCVLFSVYCYCSS